MERAERPLEAPDPGLAARTVNLAVVSGASKSPATIPAGTGNTDGRQRPRRGWVFGALTCGVVLLATAAGLVLGLGLGLTKAGATPVAPASLGSAPPVAASAAPYPLSPASPAPPIVPREGPASTARSASRTPGSSTSTRASTSPRHAPSRPAQRTRSTSDG
jgi:hypothetical protein